LSRNDRHGCRISRSCIHALCLRSSSLDEHRERWPPPRRGLDIFSPVRPATSATHRRKDHSTGLFGFPKPGLSRQPRSGRVIWALTENWYLGATPAASPRAFSTRSGKSPEVPALARISHRIDAEAFDVGCHRPWLGDRHGFATAVRRGGWTMFLLDCGGAKGPRSGGGVA
jgi:hypothetical protein